MTNAGTDYGIIDQTNRNKETGIHYGVIHQDAILQAWADSAEADYGKPVCPRCGNEAIEYDSKKHDGYDMDEDIHECCDYACERCQHSFSSENAFGNEPIGWHYSDTDYEMVDCLDSDVMIIKSPFYTYARFCSPCVPGAGNLNSPSEDGIKAYCPGADWFEDECAPFPIYSVVTDKRVG